MTPVSLSELAASVDGQLTGTDCRIAGFSTDTRTLNHGDVYFCLRGDNFDGHNFVQLAIEKGAAAVICEKDLQLATQTAKQTTIAQLIVADTRQAFGRFAMLWRKRYTRPVIGITGSNGKTTVKQLLASILSCAGTVHYTRANDNNEIGVPQTLLGLNEQHDFAVVEMGASDKGEIKWLGELVQPTISVITNASAAHLEGFGDARAVAEEKAWIYKHLSATGTAVVNADDQFADYWREICGDRKILTFGVSGDVCGQRESDRSLSITHTGKTISCEYQLAGQHNAMNAAAAAACAIAAGVSPEIITDGLSAAEPVAGRLNFISLTNNVTVVDDTYNANPASTRAAIDVLGEFKGQRFMVLGDLLELGDDEVREHRMVGEYARLNKVDRLFACGNLSKHTVDEFGATGQWFQSQQELIDVLTSEICVGCAVLVKGSRSMKMERVTAAVSEHFAVAQSGACCQ